MNYSYEVTPTITQDPITGEETVRVMDAQVRSSAGREEANIQNVREQANGDNFYFDEEGNARYELEANDQDLNILIQDVGGREAYDEMTFWAMNTLTDNDLAEFDEVIESGDLTAMAGMIGQLQQLYQNRSHDVAEWDDAERFVYNEVCSPEVFRDVKDYLVTQSDDATINEFNTIMNSNNEDDISYAINVIVAEMRGEEFEDEDDEDDDDEDYYED